MDDLQHKLCSALEISKDCGVEVQHRMVQSAESPMLFYLHHKGNLNIFRGGGNQRFLINHHISHKLDLNLSAI